MTVDQQINLIGLTNSVIMDVLRQLNYLSVKFSKWEDKGPFWGERRVLWSGGRPGLNRVVTRKRPFIGM